MKKGLIIYDFDGVIVNSKKAVCFYYDDLFRHFDFPLLDWENPDVFREVFGMTHRQLMARYVRDEKHLEETCSFMPNYTSEEMIAATPLEEGIAEIVPVLSKDYNLAVCTNRGDSIDMYMKHYGLDKHFSYVVTSVDVINPKPDPEGVLKIMNYFSAKEALYIGDTDADYYAAKGAGVRFISFKSALHESPVITDHRQILDYL